MNKIKFINRYKDVDSTEKYIFKDDHGTIEITRINTKKNRDIFCVPSLYGCTLGCSFCFLTTGNISPTNKKIDYETIKECLSHFENSKENRQISIMGVGDPSLNLEFIEQACKEESMVSIASIFPKELPELPSKLKIHYSLHSSIQEKRLELMPSAKLPPEKVFKYLKNHKGKSEIHYTLISGQNDSEEELSKLIELVKKYSINIKFLDFKESNGLQKSPKINHWINELKNYTTVEFYNPPGENIQGSCGQFTKVFYKPNYKQSNEYKDFNKNYAF